MVKRNHAFMFSSVKKVMNTAMHQNGKWTSAPRVLKGLVCGSYFLLIRSHIRHMRLLAFVDHKYSIKLTSSGVWCCNDIRYKGP
ncbi:hypothetical protein AHAS_Ahas16G0222700 [Arachis hypogaea]